MKTKSHELWKNTILPLCAHKVLSRILSFYFHGHNGGFRALHATTTSFADLSRWTGKPVVTWERWSLALACVGNAFAHRLSTHLIRPPEGEERNTGRKNGTKRAEKGERRTGKERRKGTSGFHRKSVALSTETLQGDWWTWTIASFAALSRIFRGSSGNSGAHIVSWCKLQLKSKHQRLFPLLPKSQKHRPPCHEGKTKMSFRDLSRSNFTFAIFREPAFPCHKSAIGQLHTTPWLKQSIVFFFRGSHEITIALLLGAPALQLLGKGAWRSVHTRESRSRSHYKGTFQLQPHSKQHVPLLFRWRVTLTVEFLRILRIPGSLRPNALCILTLED